MNALSPNRPPTSAVALAARLVVLAIALALLAALAPPAVAQSLPFTVKIDGNVLLPIFRITNDAPSGSGTRKPGSVW